MKIRKALGVLAMGQANAAIVILSCVNVDFEFDGSLSGLFGTFGVEDDPLELHKPAHFPAQTGAYGVVSASQATSNIEIIVEPKGDDIVLGWCATHDIAERRGQAAALFRGPFILIMRGIKFASDRDGRYGIGPL